MDAPPPTAAAHPTATTRKGTLVEKEYWMEEAGAFSSSERLSLSSTR